MNPENLNSFILANPEKCVGCRTCEIACALAHLGQHPAVAGEVNTRLTPRVFVVNLEHESAPIMCRHCEDSPCANVCKMGAISREDGRVMVNPERCVGCRLCLMACPFGAIEFAPLQLEVASIYSSARPAKVKTQKILHRANKCDLCFERPEGPACVAECPHHALTQVFSARTAMLNRREAAIQMQASVKTTFPQDQGE